MFRNYEFWVSAVNFKGGQQLLSGIIHNQTMYFSRAFHEMSVATQTVDKPPWVYGLGGLLPYSQKPTTGIYFQPVQSSLYTHILCP